MVSEFVNWPRDEALEAKHRELEEAIEEDDDERIDRVMSEIEASKPPAQEKAQGHQAARPEGARAPLRSGGVRLT